MTSESYAKTINQHVLSGNPKIPQSKKFTLTFTSTNLSFKLITNATNTGNTLAVQSAIVDNTTNSNTVILTVSGTNYAVPAGLTYTIPLSAIEDADISIVSGGTGTTIVTLTNVKLPAFCPTQFPPNQPVVLNPGSGELTDYSSSITTASTSQQVCPAVSQRNYLLLQNNSADSLWFNFTNAATLASPSIELAAGESFIMDSSFVSNEIINIIGSTAGQTFTCKEYS